MHRGAIVRGARAESDTARPLTSGRFAHEHQAIGSSIVRLQGGATRAGARQRLMSEIAGGVPKAVRAWGSIGHGLLGDRVVAFEEHNAGRVNLGVGPRGLRHSRAEQHVGVVGARDLHGLGASGNAAPELVDLAAARLASGVLGASSAHRRHRHATVGDTRDDVGRRRQVVDVHLDATRRP